MNRMQKLGIDPNTADGLARVIAVECKDIGDELSYTECNLHVQRCAECIAERLLEEVKTKKVQRITTYSDAKKALRDYGKEYNRMSFIAWLSEEIEVEDEGR